MRYATTLGLLFCLVLLLGLAACTKPYPPFPASVIIQDPTLYGTWASVEEPDEPAIVSERQLEVRAGRLVESDEGEAPFGRSNPVDSVEMVSQYTIEFDPDGDALVFAAYVSRAGEIELLSLQTAGSAFDTILALPIHWFFRYDRVDDDTIRLTPPRDGALVVWLPEFEPADGPESPDDLIPLRDSSEAYRISGSIDRVLRYYETHGTTPGFWNEEDAMELKRTD